MLNDVINDNKLLGDALIWALGVGHLLLGLVGFWVLLEELLPSDISPVAVAVASYNVQRYDLQKIRRCTKQTMTWLWSWFIYGRKSEARIVVRPLSENISGLQAEVSRHEPRLALDSGVNGMDDLLHLCRGAASIPSPGGLFAFRDQPWKTK